MVLKGEPMSLLMLILQFLGSTEVDQPKGIEVVKEGIRKLKFNQQLKKAEGSKTPKVELTVSIDGVAIHEPKTKVRIEHLFDIRFPFSLSCFLFWSVIIHNYIGFWCYWQSVTYSFCRVEVTLIQL